MFNRKKEAVAAAPGSERWQPWYNVPRNSVEDAHLECGVPSPPQAGATAGPFGRSKRVQDTSQGRIRVTVEDLADEEEELTSLTHWLETLSELYMNKLDTRARWDPRWLNITRRERYEGMASVSVTIIDYFDDDTMHRQEHIVTKNKLADALQSRPENSDVRVVLVSDLSRFVMGALGHMLSIDPEFWFDHLVNSGYAASDSGLKLKSASWMNWPERDFQFRHRSLPGIGQRTEWNVPRRTRDRKWTSLRWGRLGLLNYLGRKGFHEDEIKRRLGDGRWVMERDVLLDKHGLLMTEKRQAQAEKTAKKRKKKEEKERKNSDPISKTADSHVGARSKTSNVYRAYTTFDGLPRNPASWWDRDLRVVAPEGASYWPSVDDTGKKTSEWKPSWVASKLTSQVVMVFDPLRSMKNHRTKEVTPSLTFMPRAMELETYTDEEWWNTAGPDETFLDPPPSLRQAREEKKAKRAQKKAELKQNMREKKVGFQEWLKGGNKKDKTSTAKDDETSEESDEDSDSEYDTDYEDRLRSEYANSRPHRRDRDFARKYALSTHDLFCRYMSTMKASDLRKDDSLIPSILTRMLLDDLWQLLAEIRLDLDHLDNDLGDLDTQLLELGGATTRQNLNWLRSTLQELGEWTEHVFASRGRLSHSSDLQDETKELSIDLIKLQARARNTLELLTAFMGLAQSSHVIDQTAGINKLTELAFFFVPISFITSAFSMQVAELTNMPPKLWTWGVALTAVVLTTYAIRSMVRSPSIRYIALHIRATILNRFTSTSASSDSHQTQRNSIGNRAVLKFVFFVVTLLGPLIFVALLYVLIMCMIFGLLWLGVVAIAIYFIVERWPDPAVLAPCFFSIPLALAAWCVCVAWEVKINRWGGDALDKTLEWYAALFPSEWQLDRVNDSDLAKEGVFTYARQALVLST